jgi:hypothetical protein
VGRWREDVRFWQRCVGPSSMRLRSFRVIFMAKGGGRGRGSGR